MDLVSLMTVIVAFVLVATSSGPATLAAATVSKEAGRRSCFRFGLGLSVGLAFWVWLPPQDWVQFFRPPPMPCQRTENECRDAQGCKVHAADLSDDLILHLRRLVGSGKLRCSAHTIGEWQDWAGCAHLFEPLASIRLLFHRPR